MTYFTHCVSLLTTSLLLATGISCQSITGANGVNHSAPFTGSITLSPADNPHSINGDVYIEPGATLTILPGVRFESDQNSTLAICRGAQIFAEGTQEAPITFTSVHDTGSYRQNANNEWGNLTIMGAGYISEDEIATNTATPTATNYADMEGLTPANVNLNDYGGGNDNDDSGSLSYCTFSYGGVASIPGKELNGLSLGGIGRQTDVHHIEILNNIDDGIEVWGGTVNLKYLSIWNIGDDSLDIDQGWRGKAQFGLIVQGASNNGAQGSGFGDNAMEIDGAERCDWQPVTTGSIWNFTVIGGTSQTADPAAGSTTDELVELRDNARIQFGNCIFMDAGKEVFNDKVTDGEVNNNLTICGPGSNVPQMLARMTTPATVSYGLNAFSNPATAYQAQDPAGNLVQVRGCIYYNNNNSNAYSEALSYGIFDALPVAGTNHANNDIVLTSPITQLTRSTTPFTATGHSLFPVTYLDPTPTVIAQTAAETAPDDGFFTPASYVGGFSRGNNWLTGWSMTSRVGLTSNSLSNQPITGVENAGSAGAMVHYTDGNWQAGTSVTLGCDNLADLGGISVGVLVMGFNQLNLPVFGGIAVPTPDFTAALTGIGSVSMTVPNIPFGMSGARIFSQYVALDPSLPANELAISNGQSHILP